MNPLARLLAGASLLALAACDDPTRPTYGGEAGLTPMDGFGASTSSNLAVQSGDRSTTESLSARFAAEVPATVNFAFNSAALDAEALRVLSAQAAFIRAFPEVRFAVTGHADLVGSEGANYALGLARARAAVAVLVSQGVEGSRLQALVSEGETMPVVATQAPERANRRAVTTVSGFVENHPTVLNGRYAEVIFREYVGSAVPPPALGGDGGAATGGAGTGGEAAAPE